MASVFKALVDLAKNRPALILGLISAALTLGAAFGLHLIASQNAAILAFAQAILALFANASTVSKAKYNALISAIKDRAKGA